MAVDIDKLPDEAKKALQQFREFQLASFNDSGANGYVIIGRHNVLRKDVAIKIYFHDKNEIDQEPAIIASINHENILKVYDARKVEETCSYYMMQAANEGDLFDFSEKYYLSTALSHKLLCQLLSGLSALHCKEKNLVHRDLKPENLLIHNDTVVIADFGSVRQVNEATGKAPSSKHSILYRPPEAFGENSFFDFSSDVYQSGLIGYLLFGGALDNDLLSHLNKKELKELNDIKKVGGDYEISIFIDSCLENKITSGRLLNWNSLPFYIPRAVKRVLRKAITTHDKRYKNVSEFLSELAKIKARLPEWIVSDEDGGYILNNWKGNDYLLIEQQEGVLVKKRRHNGKSFRIDNSIKASNLKDTYNIMKENIGLP